MSESLGCSQHSLINCTQCREKEILESLREELADFRQRDERANDRLMEEVALARSWMNKFDARQNKVNELESKIAEEDIYHDGDGNFICPTCLDQARKEPQA